MKKILILVLLLGLVGCAKVDVEKYNYVDNESFVANVTLGYSVILEDESTIAYEDEYVLNYDGDISTIENEDTVLIDKDGVTFLNDGSNNYRYDDYDRLRNQLMPLELLNNQVKSVKENDNTINIELTEDGLKTIFGLTKDDKVISHSLVWIVENDKIVEENYEVKYLKNGASTTISKQSQYQYQDVEIDTSIFAYQEREYKNYEGVCRFGNDVMVEKINIIDDGVESIVRSTKSKWDSLSFVENEKEAYIENLQNVYKNIEGVDFSVNYDEEYLYTEFVIDVTKLNDKSLKLLNIKSEGTKYIHDLYSRGFICE